MKIHSCYTPPFSCLILADGQKFLLHPTDSLAAEIVSWITNVMNLSPGSDGREIFVTVTEKSIPENFPNETGPLVCCLLPGVDKTSKILQMAQLARYIATQTMSRGGMLIHGGLIVHEGEGIILAAQGETGKSTACSRLPPSWEALSDDATLVVKTCGRYLAHPWPTWSRFFTNESPGEGWNVEQAVPLLSIFFLEQSPVDLVEPLSRGNATVFVMESIRQVMLFPPMVGYHCERKEEFQNNCLSAVEQLVNTVPNHILKISLGGKFWEEITKTLRNPGESTTLSPVLLPNQPLHTSYRVFNDQSIPIIYSGPSMNPIFRDADLLEVVPYGTRPYLVGDVICFNSPKKDEYIIHRIVSIHKEGVRTRGDNNTAPDPELVQPDDIIGKAVAVSRSSETWRVPGGTTGIILHMVLLTRKLFLKRIDSLTKTKNPVGLCVRYTRYYFILIMKPRYVQFSTRNSRFLRLYLGTYLAGDFNTIRKYWIIKYPFSLFIDKNTLPVVEPPAPIPESSEGIQ